MAGHTPLESMCPARRYRGKKISFHVDSITVLPAVVPLNCSEIPNLETCVVPSAPADETGTSTMSSPVHTTKVSHSVSTQVVQFLYLYVSLLIEQLSS